MSVVKEWFIDEDQRYSRYRNDMRIMYDTEEKIIETPDRINFQRSNEDQMYTVEIGFENRLDLISWKVYGDARYWWVIAMASNIEDPFDVPIGTVLRVPPYKSIKR